MLMLFPISKKCLAIVCARICLLQQHQSITVDLVSVTLKTSKPEPDFTETRAMSSGKDMGE